MAGFVEVFGRMLVRRTVAASDVATNQAHAQVDPAPADLKAVLAPIGARCNVSYLLDVSAGHRIRLLLFGCGRLGLSRCGLGGGFTLGSFLGLRLERCGLQDLETK